MESSVAAGLRVGLVAGVHQGPSRHRVDAGDALEEIRPLGELIDRRVRGPVSLNPDLAGACEDLPRHQVGEQTVDDPLERDLSVDEVILVAAVAVAFEVGVVLVEADDTVPTVRCAAVGALEQDALPGAIRGDQIRERAALGGGVLGVRVVVVEPGAV